MKLCEVCGAPVKRSRPSRPRRYCSRECVGHSKTNGGWLALKDGRWKVRLRSGSWQLYSRCLMEAYLGRHLTYNEVVHHVNEDVQDDRIENLQVMSRSEHTGMHSTEYWATWRILRSQGRA